MQKLLQDVNIPLLLSQVTQKYFTQIAEPLKSLAKLEEEDIEGENNLTFVKQRRHVAKLMTIVLRDFNLLMEDQVVIEVLTSVWTLAIQNMTYLLPFYQERILFASEEQRIAA